MRVLKWLDKHTEEVILVLLMVSIIVVMTLQIFFRYVLNNSLSWSEEFCRYCFIWFMFIGFPYSISLRSDLKIDAIANLFPKSVQKIFEIISVLLCLAVTTYLFYHSFGTVAHVAKTGEKSTALSLPLKYVYVSSVLGYGLGVVRCVQRLIRDIIPGKED